MDFSFTAQQLGLREDLRAFLDRELPPFLEGVSSPEALEEVHFCPEFSRKMGQAGWIGIGWPREHGGRQLGPVEIALCWEELIHRRAPIGYHFSAERQIGPSIMVHGTREQKARFLPAIIGGELSICLGYSEPNAGSDLASLRTAAVRDGDAFVISGQKVYTSGAHRADYIWLATRTDPSTPKHRGLSVFLVPLTEKGIVVRPFFSLVGHRMNEVFFDQVRVPQSTLVGEENKGWEVIVGDLDFERSGIDRLAEYWPLLGSLVRFAREDRRGRQMLARSPGLRLRLAELAVEYQVGRLLCYRTAWSQAQGAKVGWQGSQSKLFASEWGQRVAAAGAALLGPYVGLWSGSPRTPLYGVVPYAFLRTFSHTIRAGTSEVQRNIIATRGLGLPR